MNTLLPDCSLLASISTEPLKPAAVAILSSVGVLAVIGAIGYGVFLWAMSGPPASARLLSSGSLAGLTVLGLVFVLQNLADCDLRGDEHFGFMLVMVLFLFGLWGVSFFVSVLTVDNEFFLKALAGDALLAIPVMLSCAHSCSLP